MNNIPMSTSHGKGKRNVKQVESIADRILQKSNNAISKIEENIKLTATLRKSNTLLSEIDTKIDDLTNNLQQYQYYLSQLSSLLIRSEFFEAQLNMLEAHNQLNSLRSSNGMPNLSDWRDKDLNWRTTEATLENLYLEYQYLTTHMQDLSDPQSLNSFVESQYQQLQPPSPEPLEPSTIQDKYNNGFSNLKPMRIISRTQERQRRRSVDWKRKKPIALIPNIVHNNQQQLPTPETTFDATFENSSEHSYNNHNDFLISPTRALHCNNNTRRNSHTKHTRCASLPESVVSNMLDTVKFTFQEDSLSHELKKDRKFSLRHFISHDTGLKTKGLVEEEDEDVKDSEFLNSPVSIKLEPFLKDHVKRDEPVVDLKESTEDDWQEEATVFEHKLNRSNSCDSIFSMMKPEPIIPRDNTQQTMNWMKHLAKPQASSVKESNVTTLSINNLSSSISSPSRQALSNLVSQNSMPAPQTRSQNKFPFMFAAKRSSPLAATTTTTTTVSDHEANTFVSSIPTPKRQLSVDDGSSYHSFESSYSNSQQHRQWSLLLDKFKPKNLVTSHSSVTSEVGKPLPQTEPIPITPTTSDSSQRHKHTRSVAHDKVKGSFSTLTIGPNGSRIVQHGPSSTLGKSMVLTSRISQAALRDALNNDFTFQ